jgi:hypothetical protein
LELAPPAQPIVEVQAPSDPKRDADLSEPSGAIAALDSDKSA